MIKISITGNSSKNDFIKSLKKELLELEFPENIDQNDFISRFIKIVTEYDAKPNEISWDLACFRGKQILYDEYKVRRLKFWDEFWGNHTKGKRLVIGQSYSPPNSFNPLLRNENASNDLFILYQEFKEQIENFDENLFLHSFFRYRNTQTPVITDLEKEIINTALIHQTRDNTKIAEKIMRSESLVSRCINDLRELDLLYIGNAINLHAIGLNTYAVYLKLNDISIDEILPQSRWIFSTYRSYLKTDTFLRYYIVPASPDGYQAINNMRKKLRELAKEHKVLRFNILERSEHIFVNFNLEHYNCNTNSWEIPLYSYYPLLLARWNESPGIPSHVIKRTKDYSKLKYISQTDIDIINAYFRYGQISNKQLRNLLKIKNKTISESIKRLRDANIIKERIQLNSAFYPEGLLIFSEIGNKSVDRIVSTFAILPEFYLETYSIDTRSIIAIIRMPSGQTSEVALALERIFENDRHEIFILPELYGIAWSLPIKSWNEKEQKWEINSEELIGEF